MPLRNVRMHDSADKVVVNHFVNAIVLGAGAFHRYIEINIEHDALRCMQFEVVNANVYLHGEATQKKTAAS
jgi:hypothetical protein